LRRLPGLQFRGAQLSHAIADIGRGADRNVHRASVGREHDVARAVAAAGRHMRHDGFGRRARLEVAAAISKTDDRIGVADVDPFRVMARRVEGDAERPVKPVGENAHRRGLAAVRPQHPDAAGFALGGKGGDWALRAFPADLLREQIVVCRVPFPSRGWPYRPRPSKGHRSIIARISGHYFAKSVT
jgi:hypothetical protein